MTLGKPTRTQAVVTALFLVASAPALAAQIGAFDTPLALRDYLKALNTEAGDGFGIAVGISGETLIVGATGESSAATGVDGDASDNSVDHAGAAYVFAREGGVWLQQAYLKSPAPDEDDAFGWSVAVSGDLAVVGARFEDGGAGGDPEDDGLEDAGAAYVYVRDGDTWSFEAYLKPAHPGAGDEFGSSVSIHGELIVVGAPDEQGSGDFVNAPHDDLAVFAGAAYVFSRDPVDGGWRQVAYLKASNAEAGDDFGSSVDIWGERIVVGAPGERGDGSSPGDNSLLSSGAAYVFERSADTWAQTGYLKHPAPDDNDLFALSVAIWEDLVVAGSELDDSATIGVGGAPADDSSNGAGSASVFRREAGAWLLDAYLQPQRSNPNARFGGAVDVFEDRVLVGARLSETLAAGVHSVPPDAGTALDVGVAWLFERGGACWDHRALIGGPAPDAFDRFGARVALAADTVLVGSASEDGGSTGPGGDPTDNSADGAGSAHTYDLLDLPTTPWSDRGCAKPGSLNGDPRLAGSGNLTAGSSNLLELRNAAAQLQNVALVFLALEDTPTPFKGGTLIPVPWTLARTLPLSPADQLDLPFVLPADVPPGTELWVQVAIPDLTATQGVSLSNAIRGVTG